MKRNKIIITVLYILLISFTGKYLYASGPSLNALVTPEKGTVGQPLIYTLNINGIKPDTLKITLPDKKIVYPVKEDDKKEKKNNNKNVSGEKEKSSGEYVPLYIINNASREETDINGSKQITVKIIISYYRPGNYILPEIKVAGSDGIAVGYRIPTITIEEVNRDGALEEIEPPVSLSGNYTRIIWIIVAVVLIGAVLAAIIIYLKKRKRPVKVEELSLPPIEVFLNEVESLKLRELIKKGKINEYVFDISIIFRRYLSMMLNFDAAEMTTVEIASCIKTNMPGELYSIYGEEIISNMRLWDFSKFAEFTPSAELLLENLDATISVAKKISGISEQGILLENERVNNGTVRL